jgi:DnaJ-class molecular chaperone
MLDDNTKKCMSILEIENFPFSEATLKTQYRKKAFKFHPDVSKEETEKEMKEINSAYTYLKLLATTEFNKDFDADIEYIKKDMFDLSISCCDCNGKGYFLREIPNIEACPDCKNGGDWWNWMSLFSIYGGRGKGYHLKDCYSCLGKGINLHKKECSICSGTGKVKKVCKTCNGKGIKRNKENYFKEKCFACSGKGRIEVNLFNPVIRKGAILKGKRSN